jgi:hypothetical protein
VSLALLSPHPLPVSHILLDAAVLLFPQILGTCLGLQLIITLISKDEYALDE